VKADKMLLPRKMWFAKQFMDDLMSLVSMVTRDIIDRCVQVSRQCLLVSVCVWSGTLCVVCCVSIASRHEWLPTNLNSPGFKEVMERKSGNFFPV